MYFVPIEEVKEGMKLGRPIYSFTGQVLLQKGITLTSAYINKLKQLGYNGVYVYDSLCSEIENSSIIPDNVKFKINEYVYKTFTSKELNNDIYNIQQLENTLKYVIEYLWKQNNLMYNLDLIRQQDTYLYEHSINVMIIAVIMGIKKGFDKEYLIKLGMSALLHDIGKKFIPTEILTKPEQLTKEEFKIIQQHPVLGYEYVKKMGLSLLVCRGILDHHERYDGTGYPNGKRGKEISVFGQIISVADVYDALTTDRVYRKKIPSYEVYEYILGNNGIAFSPEAVQLFIKSVYPYPVGVLVLLSNKQQAIVVRNNPSHPLRPVIKLLSDNTIIDLSKGYLSLTITEVI